MAYDKADWHLTDHFPKDLQEEQIYVHTGFFVGWLIDNNLISEDFDEVNSDSISKFRQRQISGPKLFEFSGGVLSGDDVNDEGRLFCNYYYESKAYFHDYRDTFIKGGIFKKRLPSDYHVQDTWENYKKISKVVDKRFDSWNKLPVSKKLKYKKNFDLHKLGINDNHRAINELFYEKYSPLFEKEDFTYNKSNEYFIRNNREQKEIVGLELQFRGGCGHTIFPYFAISNKQIEKIYAQYAKGNEYLEDKRRITLEYSSDKIERDNEKWIDAWSPQGDNLKVVPILEKVISFYETEGRNFFKGKSFEKISQLLLKECKFEITHPYRSIKVIERVCKGLIASNLAHNTDTVDLIKEFRPFIHQHYSQGQWVYDKDAIEIFEKISSEIEHTADL
jgi:hypothetical protein